MSRAHLWRGALAGYAASRTMDAATAWFHRRQDDASRAREEEIAPGGALVQLGKRLGAAAGRDLDDEAAGRIGVAVHRTFGVVYGITAAALVRRGVSPLAAGLAVGAGAFLLVDEGTSLPTLTAYPPVSHARGVVGHATFGLTAGVLLALVEDGRR
ncbi:hypothetical protein [Blastococcus sp. SYSU DS0541]